MKREERIKEVMGRWQLKMNADLAAREAKGEIISAFWRQAYTACPHLAELVINLEDELWPNGKPAGEQ